jgi:hypothetical protein
MGGSGKDKGRREGALCSNHDECGGSVLRGFLDQTVVVVFMSHARPELARGPPHSLCAGDSGALTG